MTTLEDGVAELLANPLEGAVHRQVCDRLMEESPDPRRALLDLVIRHRASDGPRLAYAVYCEANGEPERGEFIRVQCELARLSESHAWAASIAEKYEYAPAAYMLKQAESLHNRERELQKPDRSAWSEPFNGWLAVEWRWFQRGFIGRVVCAADDWLKRGDAIVAEQPIEKVTLTTHPDTMWLYKACREVGLGESPGNLISNHEEILSRRWPGVQFSLPRPSDYDIQLTEDEAADIEAMGIHPEPGNG